MKYIFALLLMYFLFIKCTFHSEEDYFGDLPCDSTQVNKDTVNVVYDDLTYIFTETCLQCHNSINSSEQGIVFDSYEDVVKSMNTGKVIPAIKHETAQMPKDQPKLSDCEIQRIEIWVERGMPK